MLDTVTDLRYINCALLELHDGHGLNFTSIPLPGQTFEPAVKLASYTIYTYYMLLRAWTNTKELHHLLS